MRRSAFLAVLAGLVLVSAPARAGSKGTLKLLSSGSGHKQQLRLRLSPGQVGTMKVVLDMGMEVMGVRQSIPQIIQTMRIRVVKIMPNGDIKIRFELVSAKLGATSGSQQAVVAAMKSALAGMRGYAGIAIMDTRGRMNYIKSHIPAGVTPQVRQSLQSVERAMRNVSPPFPRQPVGHGARWSYTLTLTRSGIRLTQVVTYRLRSIRGDHISLGMTLRQSAPSQTMSQGGMSVKLLGMHGSGSGSVTMSLSKLVPTASSSYSSELSISAGSRNMRLKSHVRIKMSP